MKGLQHLFISFLLYLVVLWTVPEVNWIFAGWIIIRGAFPDWIERPTSLSHRKFFHSKTFLKFLGVMILILIPLSIYNENYSIPLFFF